MLALRCIKKTRAFLSPAPPRTFVINDNDIYSFIFILSSSSPGRSSYNDRQFSHSSVTTAKVAGSETTDVVGRVLGKLDAKDVAFAFREWFKSPKNVLFDRIFEILGGAEQEVGVAVEYPSAAYCSSADLALKQLGLRLSEAFVVEVLQYGKDVLSCLKFFDWAGRQREFCHTRVTYHAIFKILSRAKLMSLMFDFLDSYHKLGYGHKDRFYNTLVMGYAVAGRLEVALQLFGRMRFMGIDLDDFVYHVLLNALVEECHFDAVDCVAKQIAIRGFESPVTHSILVKNFCKQKQLDKAESFLRELLNSGWALGGYSVSILVDALCKIKQFEKAGELLEEFGQSGVVSMESAYGMWIRNLVRAGKLDDGLKFFRSKQSLEGYVPSVFRYNLLIFNLLKKNRLVEVYDLLMEMMEYQLSPTEATLNIASCFFYKAGMTDVALELYNLRTELGHSSTSMAYNYLINTLCGDGSIQEAYSVLKDSIRQGYFPRGKTFLMLSEALCREGKLDKMKELLVVALENNFIPSDWVFDKFISALCKAGRVEDGYLILGELNRLNKIASKTSYANMIHAFSKFKGGDIAARLIIAMQERGHIPTRKLFRAVIKCLCDMKNPEKQFFKLLEMQLSHQEPNCEVFKFFIDGAAYVKKPELAREAFDIMIRSGVAPNLRCDILMLQSYLRTGKISDALNFFHDLCTRREINSIVYNTMIAGLCKAQKPEIALDFLEQMRKKNFKPSLECCEELVRSLCTNKKYDIAVNMLDEMMKAGLRISSFIGNVLLYNSMKSQDLYWAWVLSKDKCSETSSSLMLGQLIAAFANPRMSQDVESAEELIKSIEKFFPVSIYTYNLLLRRLSKIHMGHALELFTRLRQKGYEPNRWTFDIMARGFFRNGMTAEAGRWVEEMFRRGFEPTEDLKLLI